MASSFRKQFAYLSNLEDELTADALQRQDEIGLEQNVVDRVEFAGRADDLNAWSGHSRLCLRP